MDVTEVSRQAWNAIKLETQPEYDSLMRNYALELQQRAEGVITTGEAEEGESYNARFEQKVKELLNGEDHEPKAMAMAAEIPEDVKEELVEEVIEEKPKKKAGSSKKAATKAIEKPKPKIKVVKAATKAPVAKKK
jgi:hypothetical protein